MNRKKKKNTGLLLILLILGVTIGYAILTTNLKINGIGKINKSTWSIHWDNVGTKESTAVASSPAEITDQKKTQVEYGVTFNKPGDYYEFTVDAVNDGSIDGAVDAVSNILLDGSDQEIDFPSYIKSEVTYVDGKDIEQGHILKVGRSEKYKVRVTYSSNVTSETLVLNDTTYKFRFSVTYVQSNTNSRVRGACNANLYEDGEVTESRYLDVCEDYIDESIYAYSENQDGTLTLTGFKSGYTVAQVKSAVRDITASKLLNNKELLVRKVDNNTISFKDGIWALPLTIDGKTVTKIAGDAFSDKGIAAQLVMSPAITEIIDGWTESGDDFGAFYNNDLTGVALSPELTKIGYEAFTNNKLVSASIPDKVTVVGTGSFSGNSTMTSLKLGNSIQTIESGAFYGLAVTKVKLPETLTTIGGGAFSGTPIKKLVIPDSVTTIQGGAFYEDYLEELTIGSGMTSLDPGMFNIANLKKLVVGDNVTIINSIGSTPNLEELVLGNKVETINYGALADHKVKKLVLPDSVKNVYSGAFASSITEEIYTGNGLTAIQPGTFIKTVGEDCHWNEEYQYEYCDTYSNKALKKLVIGDSVETIGGGAFSSCVNLTDLTLGKKVREIQGGAFSNTGLTSVTLPDSVQTAQGGSFSSSKIKYFNTGNGLTTLGAGVVYGNPLEELVLGNNIETVESGALSGTSTLTKVTFGPKVRTISYGAFQNCGLTKVILPASVRYIYSGAFSYNNISTLNLGGTTFIDAVAFANNNLTKVDIPSSVETIGGGAFKNNNISSLTLHNGLDTIGSNAFSGNNLKNVTIPSSVTTIGKGAFYKGAKREDDIANSNTSLTSISNKTGESFDWEGIVNDVEGTSFETGTVTNTYGNVSITN